MGCCCWAAAAGLLLLGSAAGPSGVWAAQPDLTQSAPAAPTFTVNSLADVAAAAPLTNGVCETAPSNGTCTLRAAIMKANHFPGGGVTIDLPAGTYDLSILPSGEDDETSGDLNITNTLTLNGAGAATTLIDANQHDRVIEVGAGASATIANVTLQGGRRVNLAGGSLLNDGNLLLAGVVVSGNQTTGAGGVGGGLSNSGTLTLNHSSVNANQSGDKAGGIYNSGRLTLNNSLVSGNQTLGGGDGGGLFNTGALTLTASLVSDNQSSGRGGGMFNYGGDLTAINSTISNNSAISSGGGLLQTYFGSLNAYFTTIVGNLADSAATGAGLGGGIYNGNSAVASSPHLWKTLLAGNYVANTLNECVGSPLISEDYNYFETDAGCGILRAPAIVHDVTGGDPRLDGLADNGGPTPTRALLAGSPALDVIPANQCLDEFGAPLTTDQRGFPRPVDGACDMGAYEGRLPAPGYLRNLVRNGDAEAAAGSPSGAFVGVPDWQNTGQLLTVVPYNAPGGFPSVPTDTVPASHGDNFFAGGVSGGSGANQVIDLRPLAAGIDGGGVSYDFSADLGGYFDQGDNATVEADFLDGTNDLVSQVILGPVTAADRGCPGACATALLHREASGPVPVHTRSVELFITLLTVNGPYDDG